MLSRLAPAPRFRFPPGAAKPARVSVLAALLACCAPAFAQQPPGQDPAEDSSWGLGLAVVGTRTAYRGMDREARVLPLLAYENRYLKLSGPNLELKLPGLDFGDARRLDVGIVARLFGGPGYDAGDSSALDGMADRKSSVWAGGKVAWENELADVTLEVLGDASGRSKGRRLLLGVQRKWMPSPGLMLMPRVGVEWVDRKYVDYYYGVRESEAIAGRPAYDGKSALNAEIGLAGIYRFDKHHSMMLNVGVKSLGNEIKDSPIVDRSTESRVMLGYQYRFR